MVAASWAGCASHHAAPPVFADPSRELKAATVEVVEFLAGDAWQRQTRFQTPDRVRKRIVPVEGTRGVGYTDLSWLLAQTLKAVGLEATSERWPEASAHFRIKARLDPPAEIEAPRAKLTVTVLDAEFNPLVQNDYEVDLGPRYVLGPRVPGEDPQWLHLGKSVLEPTLETLEAALRLSPDSVRSPP
ncbi:MAG: hypothetical protein AAFZ18_11220 [Myxococcota bacterium]